MAQSVKLQYNERAWAIDLISHINGVLSTGNMTIKRASGEHTLTANGSHLFPKKPHGCTQASSCFVSKR